MPYGIEWVKNDGGTGPCIREYPEGTSETFKKGAPVVFDRSEDGVVEMPLTAGVPDSQAMLGIALKDATGTAGAVIPVLLPRSGDVFKASVASAQATAVAPVADDRGQLYGIIKRSTGTPAGQYVVDTGNTTWVKVIDINPEDIIKRGGDLVAAAIPTMTSDEDGLIFRFLETVLAKSGTQA